MVGNHSFLINIAYRHILEEQITPVILDIEEEPKHQHHVHQADEDDDDHAGVHRHLTAQPDRHPPSHCSSPLLGLPSPTTMAV